MLPTLQQIAIIKRLLPDAEEVAPGIIEATCPGVGCHTTKSGKRDFRIWVADDQMPHENCMHHSCSAARDAFMRRLYQELAANDPGRESRRTAFRKQMTQWLKAPEGRPRPPEPFDLDTAIQVADLNPVEVVDDAWLLSHSPVPIPEDHYKWPELLLSNLYTQDDHILVFTKFASQGQIMFTPGKPPVRLEDYPAAPGKLPPPRPVTRFPKGAPNGVWFLSAPVTGEWQANPNNPGKGGAPKPGRRHAACATRFPYLLLESDEAPPAVWLRIITQLKAPIVAIYTSGGKSYHALVRVDAPTKEQFDIARADYITRLSAIGADPAAINAVRLTRLPGCYRYGSGEGPTYRAYTGPDGKPAPRLQRLLYLNPEAQNEPIISFN
ncbi:MAG: hypothetical protein Q3986_06465 [Akkermansia sp.]|nr:hypothetical protein [Akkermansia sp.]